MKTFNSLREILPTAHGKRLILNILSTLFARFLNNPPEVTVREVDFQLSSRDSQFREPHQSHPDMRFQLSSRDSPVRALVASPALKSFQLSSRDSRRRALSSRGCPQRLSTLFARFGDVDLRLRIWRASFNSLREIPRRSGRSVTINWHAFNSLREIHICGETETEFQSSLSTLFARFRRDRTLAFMWPSYTFQLSSRDSDDLAYALALACMRFQLSSRDSGPPRSSLSRASSLLSTLFARFAQVLGCAKS